MAERRSWVQLLTGLRVAIWLVFVFILLQPIVSCTKQTPQLPEMLILVDASQSMAQPSEPRTCSP